ncbi:hypothetical protein CLV63_10951 [Murinocardiopsis flavida]|uniref:Uncharacterized protein n=1 Tax=Murinocardiopsis flavida TaxID=645275 RepID=A0A2P8DIM5_9ACTN|nr:hypothetical protein CLV63_10951 [Murinocardiopsis flavida]
MFPERERQAAPPRAECTAPNDGPVSVTNNLGCDSTEDGTTASTVAPRTPARVPEEVADVFPWRPETTTCHMSRR